MAKNKEYYSVLGIPRTASLEDIREAYFAAAKRLHPDTNVAPGETEIFFDVQEAYEVLSNPKKRAAYDETLPPEVIQPAPLDHRVLFSRTHLLTLNEPQLVYVLVEFSPKPEATQPITPPLNICLVIDRSSSMQGMNINVVKDTANQIIKKLKDTDYFSLVTFSDRAEIVIPAEKNIDPKKLAAKIQMIQCSGGTEIFNGLETGYKEVLRNLNNSPSNHIILLTDGRTYGDEKKCLELSRIAADKGITIRGLGIGPEWNDVFMDELTSLTGGNSMYVSRPQDIQRILLKQINQISVSIAEETRLDFTLPEQCELNYAFRITPDPGLLQISSPIRLGSVLKDSTLQVLMEFIVHSTQNKETATLLEGKVNITLSDVHGKNIEIPMKLSRSLKHETSKDPPPAEIVSALSKLTLYRLQEQVRLEAAEGDYEQAAEHLQRLATHLLACGERDLARTALLEAEQITHKKSISQENQKEIKYGTRALLISGER